MPRAGPQKREGRGKRRRSDSPKKTEFKINQIVYTVNSFKSVRINFAFDAIWDDLNLVHFAF